MVNNLNSYSQGVLTQATPLKGSGNLFPAGNKKDTSTPGHPLLAALEKTDPEKAGELKKQQEDAQRTLENLNRAKQDINEQRKAAAEAKIQQIKEKLKALRLLAAVNPEAAARQAKQLAGELKQAVQEYATASGGGADTSLQAGTDAIGMSATSVETPNAESTTATATTAGVESAEVIAGTETITLDKTAKSGETAPQNMEKTNDGQSEKTVQDTSHLTIEEIKKKEEDQKEIFREKIQEQIAESNKSFAGSQADRDFAGAVEEVQNSLKSIIEMAKKKLQEKDDSLGGQDIKDAENALSEVDKALGDIFSGSISGTMGVVNILA